MINDVQLQATTPDGRVQTIQLAKLNTPADAAVPVTKPLLVKTQAGYEYKLIDKETGGHLKGQKLLRSQKNTKRAYISYTFQRPKKLSFLTTPCRLSKS